MFAATLSKMLGDEPESLKVKLGLEPWQDFPDNLQHLLVSLMQRDSGLTDDSDRVLQLSNFVSQKVADEIPELFSAEAADSQELRVARANAFMVEMAMTLTHNPLPADMFR